MGETVSRYSFHPRDLDVPGRKPGISAFMRIRNGADFLEATIRSHIGLFDEIVAVHNQCSDATPDILARLEGEFPGRLKVWHYADRVFPPGSEGHARTPAEAPESMVNYSNFALSRTTRQIVTKLDDDHLAIPAAVRAAIQTMMADPGRDRRIHAFSGLNLIEGDDGGLAIPGSDPVSGNGDIGFFTVREDSVFTHDRRFERVPRAGFKRVFCGMLYWHLKYLKTGLGFANYELGENPNSRFAARQRDFAAGTVPKLALEQLGRSLDTGLGLRLAAAFSNKRAFILDRNLWIARNWASRKLPELIKETTDPEALALASLATRHWHEELSDQSRPGA